MNSKPVSADECCCFVCNECPMSFPTLEALQLHMTSDHLTATSISSGAAACLEQFKESKMDVNMNEIDKSLSSGNASPDVGGSDIHQADGVEAGYIPTTPPKGRYPCEKCGRLFSDRDQLNIHYTHTHREKPQYVCDICEKVFGVKRELATHLRSHSGEEPHQCAECGKEFGTRQLLKKHNMWHNGERSHVCPHCNKAFFQKGHLTQHLMIHKGGRPHCCTLCEKTFIFKFDLNRHMKIHLERGNSCQRCGKCFSKLSLLEEHAASCDGEPALSISPTSSPFGTHCFASPIRTQSSSPSSSVLPPPPSMTTTRKRRKSTVKSVGGKQFRIDGSPTVGNRVGPPETHIAYQPSLTGTAPGESMARIARALLFNQQQGLLVNHPNTTIPFLPMTSQNQFLAGSVPIPQQPAKHQLPTTNHATFPCFLCSKEFPTQIAYVLHWSIAHLGGGSPYGQLGPAATLAALKSQLHAPQVETSGAPLTDPCMINSATNSSCASSPQKVSPSNSNCPEEPLCVSHEDCKAHYQVPSLATTALAAADNAAETPDLKCECVDSGRQKQVELEQQLTDTKQELQRLRDVMQRVGIIANSLFFNSCPTNGSANIPNAVGGGGGALSAVLDLEKLWTLQAK